MTRRSKRYSWLRQVGQFVEWTLSRALIGPLVLLSTAVTFWFASRSFKRLLVGSPALVVGGVAMTVIAWQSDRPVSAVIARYRIAAWKALQADDFAAAELFLQKVLQLNEHDLESKYLLAMAIRSHGDAQRSAEIVADLAPDSGTGYPPAHFATARELAQTKQPLTKPDVTRLIHHLRAAAAAPNISVDAQQMLGQLYLATGDHASALSSFRAIVTQRPEMRLAVAHILVLTGKTDQAKAEIDKAITYFRDKVQSNADDTDSRIVLAKALFLKGDFVAVDQILRQGFDKPNGERCRRELAVLCVAQSDRIAQSDSENKIALQLELLQRALDCAPESPDALNRLAVLSVSNGQEGAIAQSLLKDVLASGKAPATVHLVLGTQAAAEQNLDAATRHLEQAYRLNPKMPEVLNNLAWILFTREPPELERALQLAEAAVKVFPNNAEFRATRGQILVRLERWKDALVDLEIALRDLGSRPNFHEALATAYEKLGDSEMGAKHRERAKEQKELNKR